jgi:hypothetical protein
MRHASSIFFFATIVAAVPASAGPREDTLTSISRCGHLPDDRTFLDCIYGAAQPMRARLGLSPAPAAQQRLVPPPDPSLAHAVPSNATGSQRGGGLGLFNNTGLRMEAYNFDKRGLFTVTLSDGSMWRQDANDTNFAHFGGRASNYAVALVAGEYGKSRLDVRGEPGPYVVERIQ